MARKILLINSNTSVSMTELIRNSAEACKLPDTTISYVNSETGPAVIETHLDDAISAIPTLEIITRESQNYDAFIIAASPDPGIIAAREITPKPVVGIGQSPLILAALLGRKYSIIGHWKGDKQRSEDKVKKYHMSTLLSSVVTLNKQPLSIHKNQKEILNQLIKLGRKAIDSDGAEVIVLAGAAFAGIKTELSNMLGVPVLEGISASVKLAEILIDLNLSSSRSGQYKPLPHTKELIGFHEFQKVHGYR